MDVFKGYMYEISYVAGSYTETRPLAVIAPNEEAEWAQMRRDCDNLALEYCKSVPTFVGLKRLNYSEAARIVVGKVE